jgi:hypothetical protein
VEGTAHVGIGEEMAKPRSGSGLGYELRCCEVGRSYERGKDAEQGTMICKEVVEEGIRIAGRIQWDDGATVQGVVAVTERRVAILEPGEELA